MFDALLQMLPVPPDFQRRVDALHQTTQALVQRQAQLEERLRQLRAREAAISPYDYRAWKAAQVEIEAMKEENVAIQEQVQRTMVEHRALLTQLQAIATVRPVARA